MLFEDNKNCRVVVSLQSGRVSIGEARGDHFSYHAIASVEHGFYMLRRSLHENLACISKQRQRTEDFGEEKTMSQAVRR